MKDVFRKITNEKGKGIKQIEIKIKDIPSRVQGLLEEEGVNWVEEGVCCDLSTIRGYLCDEERKLHQKTGSDWEFFAWGTYTKNVTI